jgi:hypothetical protein
MHNGECTQPFHRKPSATVCILRCGSESIDYLVLGDASILLESPDTTIQVTDRRMHRIAEKTRQEQRARNTASGFSIAAYDPAAALDSVTETLPIESSEQSIHRVALFTDGAERAMSTFGLYSDWRSLMEALSTEGPAAFIRRIRQAEHLDRGGEEYPRTKFSDDASVILWTLNRRAGEGNRTPVTSLGSWSSTIELHPHEQDYRWCSAANPSRKLTLRAACEAGLARPASQ